MSCMNPISDLKKYTIMLLICLTAVLLAGCAGKDKVVSPQVQESPGSEAGNEEPSKAEDETVEETTAEQPDVADGTDYEAVYEPILDEVREVVINGYDFDREYKYISNGIMERAMYNEDGGLKNTLGYALMDLNRDGVPELLIGEDPDYEWETPRSYIYSGFSVDGGKPVWFLDGWARNRYHLLSGDSFLNSGSSGAMDSVFGECFLSSDGKELIWKDYYFTEEDRVNGGISLYHNTNGISDVQGSEKLDMSEEEFWDIEDSYSFRLVAWTPVVAGDLNDIKEKSENNSGTELSDSELKKIEDKLNSIGYNGFLRCVFDDPRDIDWNEVFYDGAGFDRGYPSPDVEKAYKKAIGSEEIMTDITTVSAKDVNRYVFETTGYDYHDDMRHKLDWLYFKEYDLYLFEHGDTNRFTVNVISGRIQDGRYFITYTGESGDEYIVSFTDADGTFRFVSNLPKRFMEGPGNNGDIDQSMITDGQIIPDSDSRKLTEDDLKGLDAGKLRIARNEIYARHGRKFKDRELQSHFDGMDWYFPTVEPDKFDESSLNEYERYNLEFISKYERKER